MDSVNRNCVNLQPTKACKLKSITQRWHLYDTKVTSLKDKHQWHLKGQACMHWHKTWGWRNLTLTRPPLQDQIKIGIINSYPLICRCQCKASFEQIPPLVLQSKMCVQCVHTRRPKSSLAIYSTIFNKIRSTHDLAYYQSSKMITLRSTEVRYEYDAKESRLISDHLPAPHRDTPSTNLITSTRVHARWCFLLIPPFAVGTVTILLSSEVWLDGSALFGLNSCRSSTGPITGHCSFTGSEEDYFEHTHPQTERTKKSCYILNKITKQCHTIVVSYLFFKVLHMKTCRNLPSSLS